MEQPDKDCPVKIRFSFCATASPNQTSPISAVKAVFFICHIFQGLPVLSKLARCHIYDKPDGCAEAQPKRQIFCQAAGGHAQQKPNGQAETHRSGHAERDLLR